jgi:hypothetical protein
MSKLTGIDRVVQVVEIGGVRLVEANVKTRVRSVKEVGEATLGLSYRAILAALPDSDGVFFVRAQMEARVTPEDEPKAEPFVTISVALELRYRVPKDFGATREELQAFAADNGVFNAWPYFREIIQTTSARMELPPILIPLYRRPKPGVQKSRRPKASTQARALENDIGSESKPSP